MSPWTPGQTRSLAKKKKKNSMKAGAKQIRRKTANIIGARIYVKSVVTSYDHLL
jgi:hypothetical protein